MDEILIWLSATNNSSTRRTPVLTQYQYRSTHRCFMGVIPQACSSGRVRFETPIEAWPYHDQVVLLKSLSPKVIRTCHWFRHHARVNSTLVLTCLWHQRLIAHGEHFTNRCLGQTDDMVRTHAVLRRWPEQHPKHVGDNYRLPLSPKETRIGDGRLVLQSKPPLYECSSQSLEVTFSEAIPDGAPPLLKGRKELSREEANKLWTEKRQQDWRACLP